MAWSQVENAYSIGRVGSGTVATNISTRRPKEPLPIRTFLKQAGSGFSAERVGCYRGPGYFLISHSLLFRIPKSVKRAMAPTLMVTESVFNRIPMSWVHPYFVARWVRNSD